LSLLLRGLLNAISPGASFNKLSGHVAKSLPIFLKLLLKLLHILTVATDKLVMELTPEPGSMRIAGKFSLPMHVSSGTNSLGPTGSYAGEPFEQPLPALEVSIPNMQFTQPFISRPICLRVFAVQRIP
jgi:hypothetical protein